MMEKHRAPCVTCYNAAMTNEPAPIRPLADHVINQIAAGEVVDRPASVMKELMENSLDAGATRIEVEVVDGGRKLIRVLDNGSGMDRANAMRAIERHATSKLRDLNDLDTLTTMGFRGEALAATSAVSQFTLLTCRPDCEEGTEILIFGGRLQDVRPAGMPPGTDVFVRNLFFNLPARRKFLRSAQTEFTHIRQHFILEALAHPETAFILRADDREVFNLPATDSFLERIRDIYGEELTAHLAPLNYDNGIVAVSGYAGIPPFSRMDREWQVSFINNRPASSPIIHFATQTAYRDALPGGRYAPLFLQIRIPTALVDVNVHPAKKEVRFRRPTEVRDTIIEAIRLAIAGADVPGRKQPPADDGTPRKIVNAAAPTLQTALPPATAEQTRFTLPATSVHPVPAKLTLSTETTQAPAAEPSAAIPASAATEAHPAVPWKEYSILGRIAGLYLAIETPDGLVLVDARSAHERIVYEQLIHAMENQNTPAQGLLSPAVVSLSHSQSHILQTHLAAINQMGFGIEPFGEDTFKVESLPVWLAGQDPALLLSDIADALLQGGRPKDKAWIRPVIATAASKRAVAVAHKMDDAAWHALLKELARTEMPYTSPRGRPTMLLFSLSELNRKFGRDA